MKGTKLLMVGCGKMGSALLGGFIEKKIINKDSVMVIEPEKSSVPKNVKCVSDLLEVSKVGFRPDIILFAVKPQSLNDILPEYRSFVRKGSLIVSIAAGKTIGFFENMLPVGTAVVRTMPNLPAVIGEGVTGLFANKNVSDEQKKQAKMLFDAIGNSYWVEKEGLLDSITAISGSGPAYLFYFMECLEEAAIELGIPYEDAKNIVKQLVIGSAKLAEESDKNVSTLREQVTSPAGTTAAALEVLMKKQNIKQAIIDAASAAKKRSEELAG